MIKARYTSKCFNHQTRPDWLTLLLDFDGTEDNVRRLNGKVLGVPFNWQPRSDDYKASIQLLAAVDSEFKKWLVDLALFLEYSKPVVPRTEKSIPVTELAEMIYYE